MGWQASQAGLWPVPGVGGFDGSMCRELSFADLRKAEGRVPLGLDTELCVGLFPNLLRCVPAIETPNPICPGLVPPVESLGAVPSEKFRLNVGAKIIRLDLNAIVLTLAMLLPITSKLRALAANPDNPVNIATVEAM